MYCTVPAKHLQFTPDSVGPLPLSMGYFCAQINCSLSLMDAREEHGLSTRCIIQHKVTKAWNVFALSQRMSKSRVYLIWKLQCLPFNLPLQLSLPDDPLTIALLHPRPLPESQRSL